MYGNDTARTKKSILALSEPLLIRGYNQKMRQYAVAMACVVSLLPFAAFAAAGNLPAGFAPGSLWLSKTEATSGDALKIYTVVYDSSVSPIEGDVVFNVDAKAIDTQHFKLAAGETQILSSGWTAAAGTHTFGASLKNISGVSDAVSNAETNSVSVTVAEAAPSPLTQYSNVVTNIIASSSPTVQNIAQTIFNTTEDWRQAGSDYLSKALYTDQTPATGARTPGTSSKPEVLGTSTSNIISSSTVKNGMFGSLWRSILQGLLYVFNIKILFYILLLITLYILYKIVRAFFSERRPY